MDSSNHSTTSRLLIAGVVLTFIIALSFTWPLFRKAVPGTLNNNQPMEVIPERTPAEIISSYQAELAAVNQNVDSITMKAMASSNSKDEPLAKVEAEKILNTFFFSARVPDAARTAHLKAALEFQNTDPKKSDSQKLLLWQEIIKKLQTAVAAV